MAIPHSEVLALHHSGMTGVQIAEKVGCTPRNVSRILRINGIERSHLRRPPKYKINEWFFREWSDDMAYVLGFIITDGHISKNTLTIAQKDDYILRRINEVMASTYPIKRRKNNGNGYIHTLQIYRKSIVEDLAVMGVTERKSMTVSFPDVPKEYMRHFIRGVIDGDGWVQDRGYTANITTGSRGFAEGLLEEFVKREYNAFIKTEKDRIYRVWISGKEDIIRLGRWIYKDCGVLFIPKKRERATINDVYNEIVS